MPSKSKAQANFLHAKHPKIAKEFAKEAKSIKALSEHHSGKGTRGRLEKAAEKMMFNTRSNYKNN